MTVDATARKPANRPSRRHYLIDAAVELFSLEPWEFITVADIVERAGMTPATFYYHFSSREQLLEEIVQDFAQKWIDMVERLLAAADTPDALCDVAGQLLDELCTNNNWKCSTCASLTKWACGKPWNSRYKIWTRKLICTSVSTLIFSIRKSPPGSAPRYLEDCLTAKHSCAWK